MRIETIDCIREFAYYIWLDEGKPEGKDKEHWEKAENTEMWSLSKNKYIKLKDAEYVVCYNPVWEDIGKRCCEIINDAIIKECDEEIFNDLLKINYK